jgi:hypothetical protein
VRRADDGVDQPVGNRPVVEGAGGGDDVFACVAAAAAVAPRPGTGGGPALQGFDVAGGDPIEGPGPHAVFMRAQYDPQVRSAPGPAAAATRGRYSATVGMAGRSSKPFWRSAMVTPSCLSSSRAAAIRAGSATTVHLLPRWFACGQVGVVFDEQPGESAGRVNDDDVLRR